MGGAVHAPFSLGQLLLACFLGIMSAVPVWAQDTERRSTPSGPKGSPSSSPIELTAEDLSYSQETETYEADGSVVIITDTTRLSADHVTLHMLTGKMVATGNVHVSRGSKEVWAEYLELNVNTEAGVITNGKLFAEGSNTFVTAEYLQRYSEDHYALKEGSFTNCDAMEGQTPDWRFKFQEGDLQLGESLRLKNTWFCIYDVPVLPIPRLSYPVGITRKTGILMPKVGYNTEFGFTYRQGFFWAMTPSQDLTLTPFILADRGYGADAKYRYKLRRDNQGSWLANGFQDTEQDRLRSFVNGSHFWRMNPDLQLRAKGFFVSDRTYLSDFSNSAVLRALPSANSFIDVRQRLRHGGTYLLGQYLQPLNDGGDTTFQRLPELGLGLGNWSPLDGPLLLGLQGTFVHWFRNEGFDFDRVDVMPTVFAKPLTLGNVVNLTAQVKPRFVFYSRGVTSTSPEERGTFWTGFRVDSRLKRAFQVGQRGTLLHTIEPDAIYEFVPPTDQSDIIQVDEVDFLPKKSLLTYKLRNKLVHTNAATSGANWMDLVVAQSYRLGSTQTETRIFPTVVNQPLQPMTKPVDGKKFSDIWLRGIFGREDLRPGARAPDSQFVTVDTFFNPYDVRFTQVNTDARYQYENWFYLQVGQRYTRSGNRVQRGDLWNSVSFGDVFDPTPEIQFGTASAAVRLPFGLSAAGKVIRDFDTGVNTEWDAVALYQNPCRCWSFGFYYIRFPDREQFSFLLSLTDIGNTDTTGSQLLKSLLSPLLPGKRGVPW